MLILGGVLLRSNGLHQLNRIPGLTLKLHRALAAIESVLEDEELFDVICDELSRRYPRALIAGRRSTLAEMVSHMLAVRHVYNLSYEQMELQVSDSLILRQFRRAYFHRPPDHTTLCKRVAQFQPETLQAFHERVLAMPRMKSRRAAASCAQTGWW